VRIHTAVDRGRKAAVSATAWPVEQISWPPLFRFGGRQRSGPVAADSIPSRVQHPLRTRQVRNVLLPTDNLPQRERKGADRTIRFGSRSARSKFEEE
jgi:hypothetical protein